jgi:hypothetical protein
MKLNRFTNANGATVIASSVMVMAIRTFLTAGLMDRARLLGGVQFVKEHSTSPK